MPFRSFLLVSASGAGHVGLTVALLNLQHPHGVEGVGDHLQRLGVVQREKPQKRAGIHPDGVVFIGNIYGLIRLNGQPLQLYKLRDGIKLQFQYHKSYLLYGLFKV